MSNLDKDRLRETLKKVETEELLDRITVYSSGMEPEALDVIHHELSSRGITPAKVREHEQQRANVLWIKPGMAQKCSFCSRPAIADGLRWHRLGGLIPLFPRRVAWCEQHQR